MKIIYMLPFFNAVLLYVVLVNKQLFNKPYAYFMENISPRLPIPNSLLGVCLMCTCFTTIGIPEAIAAFFYYGEALTWQSILKLFILNCVNAVLTIQIFKLLLK